MIQRTVTLDVDKFKEILLHSWELLSPAEQQKLVEMDIYAEQALRQACAKKSPT